MIAVKVCEVAFGIIPPKRNVEVGRGPTPVPLRFALGSYLFDEAERDVTGDNVATRDPRIVAIEPTMNYSRVSQQVLRWEESLPHAISRKARPMAFTFNDLKKYNRSWMMVRRVRRLHLWFPFANGHSERRATELIGEFSSKTISMA